MASCVVILSYFPHFSLVEIFPALGGEGTALGQALSQFLAIILTLTFAVVGGLVTGMFPLLDILLTT